MEKQKNRSGSHGGEKVSLTEDDFNQIISILRKNPKYESMAEESLRQRLKKMVDESAFASPMDDRIFDRVFGKSKKNLLVLLQTLLPGAGIESVQQISNRTIVDGAHDKFGVYDVVCTTDKDDYIVVEAQKFSKGQSHNRWNYYLSDLVKRQLQEGEDYVKIRPAYCIVIFGEGENWKVPDPVRLREFLDAPLSVERSLLDVPLVSRKGTKFEGQYYMHFSYIDIYSLSSLGPMSNMIFVNLDKMTKEGSALVTKMEKLLFLFKKMPTIAEVPVDIVREFSGIVDDLALKRLDKSELQHYFVDMITAEDIDLILKERDRRHSEEREDWLKEHEDLVRKHESLVQENEGLVQENEDLVQENEGLVQENESLVRKNEGLVQENEGLVQENESLVQEKESLVQENSNMRNSLMDLLSSHSSGSSKEVTIPREVIEKILKMGEPHPAAE